MIQQILTHHHDENLEQNLTSIIEELEPSIAFVEGPEMAAGVWNQYKASDEIGKAPEAREPGIVAQNMENVIFLDNIQSAMLSDGTERNHQNEIRQGMEQSFEESVDDGRVSDKARSYFIEGLSGAELTYRALKEDRDFSEVWSEVFLDTFEHSYIEQSRRYEREDMDIFREHFEDRPVTTDEYWDLRKERMKKDEANQEREKVWVDRLIDNLNQDEYGLVVTGAIHGLNMEDGYTFDTKLRDEGYRVLRYTADDLSEVNI